ncbi:hypothetical protein H4R20_004134 [Coemansia guatemalensis]|uniref:superoxide dismutase n=1 Tax=Coemansia guatemalensis TaxID=2761395 RepID=A0A9W8I0G7_9FUNG|nr:hypothetical protein H4R20_004134 [Coemansia guatemalensis]
MEPFLSKEAVEFLYNGRLVQLIDNVNRMTGGTDHEGKPIYDVIYATAQDPTQAPLLNNASQAWNIGFFLQSLTSTYIEPRDSLKRDIAEHFGTFERFQNAFEESALSLFGNGWTWLVASSNGDLGVINTFNATSPFTALPHGHEASRKGVSYVSLSEKIDQRPFVYVTPILGLSMWQEAFLLNYGLDRESYVKNFWKCVNWSAVEERLGPTKSSAWRMQ